MKTLHLVGRMLDPGGEMAAVLAPGDALVWLEEAVPAALATSTAGEWDIHEYVLQPDLDRRGLGDRQLRPGVKPIDYDGLVALVVDHPRSLTW